jgi:hypothetical protein
MSNIGNNKYHRRRIRGARRIMAKRRGVIARQAMSASGGEMAAMKCESGYDIRKSAHQLGNNSKAMAAMKAKGEIIGIISENGNQRNNEWRRKSGGINGGAQRGVKIAENIGESGGMRRENGGNIAGKRHRKRNGVIENNERLMAK